jgi:hypothetical protein
MSQAQEAVSMYLWGFIESRGHIPHVAEAYGDLTEAFAIMNSNERAMELGFTPQQARDAASVLEGSDQAGPFEIRQFYLEDVELNGTAVLFEEANHLAEAAAAILREFPSGNRTDLADRLRFLRIALDAYDARWEVRR